MRNGTKFFVVLFILACGAICTAAHPLGNFSVNQFSRIEVENSQLNIRQILDLAEIPTFQASSEIDVNKDSSLSQEELDNYAAKITPDYIANLSLTVDGSPVVLSPTAMEVSLREGEGNLRILKIIWHLSGELSGSAAAKRVRFENENNAERLGWNEIVVSQTSGINVFDSTAFGSGISDELKHFPQESLSAPLTERTAEFSYTSGAVLPSAKGLQNRDGQAAAVVQKDKFAELIKGEITFPIILAGLFFAFGFGAMHAMSPGHGKTVVGAYLVGSRGTPKHAVFLGVTVTITHTLSVFVLGFITLFASNFILPERIMPFLSFVSGLLVFFIGISLFKDRLFAGLVWKASAYPEDGHSHADDYSHGNGENDYDRDKFDQAHQQNVVAEHTHDGLTHTHGGSTHTHLPPENVTWRNLLALGVSGGLLPCPSALVLMLSAINLNRVGYGLILTLVFSFGLAATLTAIGLIFLYGGKAFGGSRLAENRVFKALPIFSAFVIACVGAIICYNSLR